MIAAIRSLKSSTVSTGRSSFTAQASLNDSSAILGAGKGNVLATGIRLPSIVAVLQTATLPLGYPAVSARNERNVRLERVNATGRFVISNVISDRWTI